MKNILTIEEQNYVKAMCMVAKSDKEAADELEAEELAFKASLFYKIYSKLYDIAAIIFSIGVGYALVVIFTW